MDTCKSQCSKWRCVNGTCNKSYNPNKSGNKSLLECKANCKMWKCNTSKTACKQGYYPNSPYKIKSNCDMKCQIWQCKQNFGCIQVYDKDSINTNTHTILDTNLKSHTSKSLCISNCNLAP